MSTHQVELTLTIEVDDDTAVQEAAFHLSRTMFASAPDAGLAADASGSSTQNALQTVVSLHCNLGRLIEAQIAGAGIEGVRVVGMTA